MPDATNYFELFQLPVSFSIDPDQLTRRYHILQKASHPDRHTHSIETAQRLALQHAMLINEAYQILQDPLQRSIYLLNLQGINPNDTGNTPNSAFLMEQITLREQLADIPQQPDPTAATKNIQKTIQSLITTQLTRLSDWFNTPDEPHIACTAVQKLQFLYKLQQEATAQASRLNTV